MQQFNERGITCSVVICTHNPRQEYLKRVLEALRAQTLDPGRWELVIVDNASTEPVASWTNLWWHPSGRIVREDELGLTPARLRGIAETSSDILVYVDDDNVLCPDYLFQVMDIAKGYPELGAWGAARIVGEFESEPEQSLVRHLWVLAIGQGESDVWSNNIADGSAVPNGVGLCVRREVAELYFENCKQDLLARFLGRRGTSLYSGEDTLLVLTARERGMGWGRFTRLCATHLIPASRTKIPYLLDLREKITASRGMVQFIIAGALVNPHRHGSGRIKFLYHYFRLLFLGRWLDWQFFRADVRGYELAEKFIRERVHCLMD